jgi:hypothetical protein
MPEDLKPGVRYMRRSVLIIIAAIGAMGATAIAQGFVTPSTPLGQGFAPNGMQSTPSNPSLGAPLQQFNQAPPLTGRSGLSTFSGNARTLNSLVAPTATGRVAPEGPIGGPERPEGPLR